VCLCLYFLTAGFLVFSEDVGSYRNVEISSAFSHLPQKGKNIEIVVALTREHIETYLSLRSTTYGSSVYHLCITVNRLNSQHLIFKKLQLSATHEPILLLHFHYP
jgi:hypothetical protein